MFTVEQFAALMHVHPNTVYRWIKDGKIKCVRIGGTIRIPDSEFPKIADPVN